MPAAIGGGQVVGLQVPGQLTIHGTTRDVTATVQARTTAAGVEVVGTIPTTMTDFGVTPPQVPATAVESAVIIEFQLELARSAA